MTTPAEAGRRGESAIELIEKAQHRADVLGVFSKVLDNEAREDLEFISENLNQALEQLKSTQDDGK